MPLKCRDAAESLDGRILYRRYGAADVRDQ
jgi:hypothetical protein